MQDRETKSALRKELLGKRDAIPPEVRRAKDRLILRNILSIQEVNAAKRVFLFASFRSEVDTSELMKRLLAEGKRVALPVVDRERHRLLLYEIRDLAELSPGYMGIPEPSVRTAERLVDISDIDLAIVPGAGFDLSGNRIGYGGGYYDILLGGLEKQMPIVAAAYEEQIVGAIPSEPHDIRIDMIVTDSRIARTSAT